MAALDTMPMLYACEDMESGGKESSIENDFAYRNNVVNASQRIRMGEYSSRLCKVFQVYGFPILTSKFIFLFK